METITHEDAEMTVRITPRRESVRNREHRIEWLPAELVQYVLDELVARNSGMWL